MREHILVRINKINECFRELHEVGDYASLLHISAGHLSKVVKTQSGKPAIKHIHERLVLEARRLLFYANNSLKEIAFELGFLCAIALRSYKNKYENSTDNRSKQKHWL